MPIKHILLAILVMAIWGANFVAIKLGLQELPPFLFSTLRFILTAIPVIFLIGKRDAPWKIIIAIGIFLGVMKFTLLFIGMDIGVPAGIASLVLQSQVFFTVLIAALLLKEKTAWNDWAGLLIAFTGIAVIAGEAPEIQSLIGLILVVVAGLCWACSNLVMKQAGSVNMLRLIIYVALIPPLPLLILSWQFEGVDKIIASLSEISATGIGALLYVVVLATIFGFAVWGYLLSRYPASKVAPFTLLVPLFGLTFSNLILGENISRLQFTGAALVMAGLLFVYGKVLIQNTIRAVRQAA